MLTWTPRKWYIIDANDGGCVLQWLVWERQDGGRGREQFDCVSSDHPPTSRHFAESTESVW
jgi:hypothetical protein